MATIHHRLKPIETLGALLFLLISVSSLLGATVLVLDVTRTERANVAYLVSLHGGSEAAALMGHHFDYHGADHIVLLATLTTLCLCGIAWALWMRASGWGLIASVVATVLVIAVGIAANSVNSQIENCLGIGTCPLPATPSAEVYERILLQVALVCPMLVVIMSILRLNRCYQARNQASASH